MLFAACNKQTEMPQPILDILSYQAGTGGKIDGKVEQEVLEGESGESVIAIPNEGYEFDKWSDGVTTAERQDTNIRGDLTVTATFQKKTYTIYYEAGENGSLQGETTQTIAHGENTTSVTALPNEGYDFDKWSDGVTSVTRTDKNIQESFSVIATFKKKLYTVRYETDECGVLQGEAIQTIAYGESSTFVTAIPNEGYEFIGWSDGFSEATRREENVKSNIFVKAQFRELSYRLEYRADAGGYIVGEAIQTLKKGESGKEVTAVAETGYAFIGWSDGFSEATRQEENVHSDILVTAHFRPLFAGGEGIAENPFTIESYNQFRNMALYPNAHYLLTKDLDLNGIRHEPIFSDNNAFNGVFDGNGKTIANLFIESESGYPSLFGIVDWNGTVKNLKVINARLNTINYNTATQNYCVGLLAGLSAGTLENIDVEGSITADGLHYQGVAIGGLVGMAYGLVQNCNANINITLSDIQNIYGKGIYNPFDFGGLIGVGDSMSIRDCSASGKISCAQSPSNAIGETHVLIGGLVAYYFTVDSGEYQIANCSVSVDIIGEDARVKAGGCIGEIRVYQKTSLRVINTHTIGEIENVIDAGGFIYQCNSQGELVFSDCSAEINISDVHTGAGFGVWVYSCSLLNCHAIGEIDSRSYAIGLFYSIAHVAVSRCYFVGNQNGRYSFSFAYFVNNCSIDQCFSESKNITKLSGGFIEVLADSTIINCYTQGNITIKNYTSGRIMVAGFIGSSRNSEVINCYSGVSIYKETENEGLEPSIAYFMRTINNTSIINCHVFVPDTKFEAIGTNRNNESVPVDITSYSNKKEMFFLADVLNTEESVVWVNRENDFPYLFYINKHLEKNFWR